jgi:acyl-coenzyme A synthetase/AMP-(fatty) acid ligase
VASSHIGSDELRDWLKTRLAPHKIPKEIHFTETLPRNPMGKTIKPDVVELVGSLD